MDGFIVVLWYYYRLVNGDGFTLMDGFIVDQWYM